MCVNVLSILRSRSRCCTVAARIEISSLLLKHVYVENTMDKTIWKCISVHLWQAEHLSRPLTVCEIKFDCSKINKNKPPFTYNKQGGFESALACRYYARSSLLCLKKFAARVPAHCFIVCVHCAESLQTLKTWYQIYIININTMPRRALPPKTFSKF